MKPLDRAHPPDDRLIAMYFGDEEANAEERRAVRQHLHGCETCTWRYTELIAPLERLRQDAASEADEVFTPARLDAQRAQILGRLQESAPSRVIPFPTTVTRLDRSVVRRPIARWIAAAAAAGLLIGVMAGRLVEVTSAPNRPAPGPVAGTAPATVQAPAPAASQDSRDEEAFLSELDRVAYFQSIAALSTLDEMTPHVRPETMLARAVR